MKTTFTIKKLAQLACITLALPLVLHAEPIPGPQAKPGVPEAGLRADRDGPTPRGATCGIGRERGPGHEGGPNAKLMPGLLPELGIPPYLRNVNLSEAQRDKLFTLMYAQLPNMRDQMKLRHKTMKELQALSKADSFDDAKAQQLATQLASAEKDMVLARARTDAKIFAILSPEQRQQLQEESKQWEERRGELPVNFRERKNAVPTIRY